ncbi:MAG: protein tyrosine phosphatase family protein [Bryobacteraceae bacterium]
MTETYNFRTVDSTLATAGLPTEEQLRSVAENGFEVVINLAVDDNPPYSLAGEAVIVRELGLAYVHIPVDFKAPTEADLIRFCDAMDANVGRKKFVHCAANKRVTVFLGLYRVIRLGWEREAAFDLVRGLWEPDAVWQAFIDQSLAKR